MIDRRSLLKIALGSLAIMGAGGATSVFAQSTKRWRMAILPYLPAKVLEDRFGPVLAWLGARMGVSIDLVVAPDYETMIRMVGENQVELAYIGPAPYVRLTERYGAKPLLSRLETNGSPSFHGVIVARSDSKVESLSDLRGRRFAFGDNQSTMSHLLPHAMLLNAGLALGDLAGAEFLGSHNNVALAVLSGDFDAGAVKDEVYLAYRERGLKQVAVTPPVSEQVFLATNRVHGTKIAELRDIFNAAWDDEQGRAAFAGITANVTNVVPASDGAFDELRGMLRKLDEAGDE